MSHRESNLQKEFTKEENLNKGQVLWNKAQQKILNGNMLLSKNPDYILPGHWPTYYEKATGIIIKGLGL